MAIYINGKTLNEHYYDEFIHFIREQFKQYSYTPTPIFTFNKLAYISNGTRFMNLWKDPKGKVHYSFNLLDSKTYTANIENINGLINEHFKFNHHIEVISNSSKHINTQKALINDMFRTNAQMFKLYGEIVTQNIRNYKNIQVNQSDTTSSLVTGTIDVNIDFIDTEINENGKYVVTNQPQQANTNNLQGAIGEPILVSALLNTNNNVIIKQVEDGFLDIHYNKLRYDQVQNVFINISNNQTVLWYQQGNIYVDNEGNQFQHYKLPSTDSKLNAINPQRSVPQAIQAKNNVFNQQQMNLYNQKQELNTQLFELQKNTQYLYTDQFPIVHRVVFEPSTKSMFFEGKSNLLQKNSYTPSAYMVHTFEGSQDFIQKEFQNSSIILKFILAMVKNNLAKAEDIFIWLARSFLTLQKEKVALVLCSKNDIYSNIFYSKIVEPLFNKEYCVEINNDALGQKKLNTLLDNKVIYHFKNITTRTFLNAPVKELIDRLLHNDDYTLYNKNM